MCFVFKESGHITPTSRDASASSLSFLRKRIKFVFVTAQGSRYVKYELLEVMDVESINNVMKTMYVAFMMPVPYRSFYPLRIGMWIFRCTFVIVFVCEQRE